MPKRSSMVDSSDSALSERSDNEFDTPQPRRPAKRARTDTSPTSLRPSKIIKLKYRKYWSQTFSQKERYPATGPKGVLTSTIPPALAQTTPATAPTQANLTNKMKLVSALELSQLRENNVFLRTQNVELAKAHHKAKGLDPDGSVEAANARQAEEVAEVNTELGRLTRQLAVLTQAGAGSGDGVNIEALTKRVEELERIRKVYFECGVWFAIQEKQWTTERQLFVQEVTGLVARVEELQGQLQEEQIKTRRYVGQIMAMQWGGSMEGAGSVNMDERAEEMEGPGLARGGIDFAGPTHAPYDPPTYGRDPRYSSGFDTGMMPSYNQQEQATDPFWNQLDMRQQHMGRDINTLMAPMEVMPSAVADTRMIGGDEMVDPEVAVYEDQGLDEGSGQWDLQG